MSLRVMVWAWDRSLPPAEKWLLVTMADHCREDGGEIFPAVERLAFRTGYHPRTVQKLLRSLLARGVIEVQAEATPSRPTTYRIRHDLPVPVASSELRRSCPGWLRREVLEHFALRCAWCRELGDDKNGPDGRTWHIDRLEPGHRGGLYEPTNVVLSCGRCNARKGRKRGEIYAMELGIEPPRGLPQPVDKPVEEGWPRATPRVADGRGRGGLEPPEASTDPSGNRASLRSPRKAMPNHRSVPVASTPVPPPFVADDTPPPTAEVRAAMLARIRQDADRFRRGQLAP